MKRKWNVNVNEMHFSSAIICIIYSIKLIVIVVMIVFRIVLLEIFKVFLNTYDVLNFNILFEHTVLGYCRVSRTSISIGKNYYSTANYSKRNNKINKKK